jgi:hypothetical protein
MIDDDDNGQFSVQKCLSTILRNTLRNLSFISRFMILMSASYFPILPRMENVKQEPFLDGEEIGRMLKEIEDDVLGKSVLTFF